MCGSVANASDTQTVGHEFEFEPRPDLNLFYKMGLQIIFRSYLI